MNTVEVQNSRFYTKIIESAHQVERKTWNECANFNNDDTNIGNPFLSHEFFCCLEDSGSVSKETGWISQHILLSDNNSIVGILPNFIKNHSWGEYIFDQVFAQALENAGGKYYPKLLSAVPFSPVPGERFLIKAGSGAMTLGLPDSPGVTKNTAKDTIIAEFNSIESVAEQFKKNPDKIAAVIIEPVAGNMGLVKSKKDFLKELRNLCDKNKSLLIFDEVMSGFRLSQGGAQQIYDVIPDITTLGKIIGGGLPVGAYGGKSEIMDYLAPNGPVYQAGTLSGNPLAMSAGLSVLNRLNDKLFNKLESISKKIHDGFMQNIRETETKAIISRAGSMMTLFFTEKEKIENYDDAISCDLSKYAKYFKSMLDEGIYLPPSQFECMFISSVYSTKDIDKIISSNKKSLQLIR